MYWRGAVARGALARRQFKKLLLRHEAAVIIQKNVRMDAARHNYYVTRNTIIRLQAGMHQSLHVSHSPSRCTVQVHLHYLRCLVQRICLNYKFVLNSSIHKGFLFMLLSLISGVTHEP